MKNINNMTESEEFVFNQRIAEKALNNAYNLIIGKVTLVSLFEDANKGEKETEVYLPFDPHNEIPETCIDVLMDHYIYTEEYEKCAELLKVKNKIESEKN